MAEEKHGRTLFVRNIPYSATNESLENVFSDIGPIKSCFVVKDKEKRFGQSQSLDTEQKDEVIIQENTQDKNQLKKKQKKGQVPVKGQKQAPNPLNEGKRARLIIRNLSFKCTKEELIKTFGKYGDVVEVHIPKQASGKRLGFGFVQFKNRTQAGMAVKEFNGKDICGRVVAVDWALPKDKFEAKLAAKLPPKDVEAEEQPVDNEGMEVDDDSDNDDSNNVTSTQRNSVASSNEDSSSSEEDEQQDSTEEDSDDENDKQSSDDVGSDEDEDFTKKTSQQDRQQHTERESDVSEGRTVFVRNLPYTVDNEELEEFFSQYGDVKYARAVVDRISGMPKGSAFVQFLTNEAANSCVEAAVGEEDSGLSIGGRNLMVSLAVSRNQAGEFGEKKDKKKEQKDTRNLYLAREGMILPGTAAAKDVTPADLALRMKIDAAKRLKLKDQNVFVSSTRLCVHNIPPTVTDQQLREILVKAGGDKQAKLVECRIMRDLNRLNSQGVGKSRGFAFCAFTQHEHALSALHHLNNNPDIFGDKKRLIVEFSLENRKALEAKQKRVEKSRAKLRQKAQEAEDKSSTSGALNRKKKYKNKEAFLPMEKRKEQDKVARSLHKMMDSNSDEDTFITQRMQQDIAASGEIIERLYRKIKTLKMSLKQKNKSISLLQEGKKTLMKKKKTICKKIKKLKLKNKNFLSKENVKVSFINWTQALVKFVETTPLSITEDTSQICCSGAESLVPLDERSDESGHSQGSENVPGTSGIRNGDQHGGFH